MSDEPEIPPSETPQESRPAGEERFREARDGGLRAAPPPALEFDEDDRELRARRREPREDDLNHLRWLSIFHYVVGGLALLCYSFPIIHLIIGIGMVSGSFPGSPPPAPGRPPPPPPPTAIGWMFVLFAGTMIAFGWAFAAGLFTAGWMLRRRRGYVFCLVMAGIACLFQPFGMILGVFTIIVLLRPRVKELFGRAPSATAAAGGG
jgi:hypothetical protein